MHIITSTFGSIKGNDTHLLAVLRCLKVNLIHRDDFFGIFGSSILVELMRLSGLIMSVIRLLRMSLFPFFAKRILKTAPFFGLRNGISGLLLSV